MLVMNSRIEIGKFIIDGMVECSHSSSWENLTDTAKIVIPKKLKWQGQPVAFNSIGATYNEKVKVETHSIDDDYERTEIIEIERTAKDPIFKREDEINIYLGYGETNEKVKVETHSIDDDYDRTELIEVEKMRLPKVFTGYLTSIKTDTPIEIMCQDEMFKLKKVNFQSAYRKVTISQLLSDFAENVELKYKVVADYELGSLRTKQGANMAQILDEIRKDYFCQFFFRDGILYAGMPYVAELQKEHQVRFNRHVVTSDLEYMVKDDIKIKMKCVILYPNGKKEEFEVGDPEGETRTFHKYDIPKAEMKRLALIEIERLRYDGYRGTVEIFGEPYIRHGDIVEFINEEEPERTGKYLIKRVDTKFSKNGYRQTLYPEKRIIN